MKFRIPLLFAFLLVFTTSPEIQAKTNLEQIQHAILSSGAQWTAGESWVTRLSPEERRKLCGTILGPPSTATATLLTLPPIPELPAQFDWRNNNGNWVTPVRDQGGCGSCWDFSALGQVEAWWKILHGRPDTLLDLSEQYVLSCSDGSCDGWSIDGALEFVRVNGVPLEPCFRYQANDLIPCSNACPDAASQALRIPGWGFITLEEAIVENIKNAVYRHPVSASYVVFEDFMFYTGGVYEHVWGDVEAGHAILIVGWNDAEQCWICKNSWEKGWGESGYFRIKWGDSGMGTYCPFIWDEMNVGPAIEISPKNLDYSLTIGDSVLETITIKNNSPHQLEFAAMDYGDKAMFHTSEFNAWDGKSWWCGDPDQGGYLNRWLQYLETPPIDLSQTTAPRLALRAFWSIEKPDAVEPPYDGWDGCNLWISTDGGESFSVLVPETPAYNCQSLWSFGHPEQGFDMGTGIAGWGGSSNGWQPVNADLSAYKTNQVILRFAFASDLAQCSLDNPQLTGFFVDDILVSDGAVNLFEDHANDAHSMKKTCQGHTPGADWIKLVYNSGIVAPQSAAAIGLSIETRGLTPGDYSGLVVVKSNDAIQPEAQMTFSFQLQRPDFDLAVESVDLPGDSLIVISVIQPGARISNAGLKPQENFDVACLAFIDAEPVYGDTVHVAQLLPGATQSLAFKAYLALETGDIRFKIQLLNFDEDYNEYNNSITSTTAITNLVDGFESKTDYWNLENGWQIYSEQNGHTGAKSAHISSATATSGPAILTFVPGFEISRVDKAILKFWTRHILDPADECYVELSANQTDWVAVDSLTGNATRWKQREITLNAVNPVEKGLVWLRFRFVSPVMNTKFGLLIDDVEIYPEYASKLEPIRAGENAPGTYTISQNYPNPFNMTTRINYVLPEAGEIEITIFNITGQRVRNLVKKSQTAGTYAITWDGLDNQGNQVGSGIYMYQIQAGHFQATKKIIFLK